MCNNTLFPILVACLLYVLNPQFLSANETSSYKGCQMAPSLSCPEFVWLKPSESAHPDRTGYAVAYLAPHCGDPIITFEDEIFVINACHKVYTRIWTATNPDYPSLIDTCHQTIKVVDEEPPSIQTSYDDIVIYTSQSDNNPIGCSARATWFAPWVNDNHLIASVVQEVTHDGKIVNLRQGNFFPEGITNVKFIAYDFCGNTSETEFDIIVMCADCHLSCPEDITVAYGAELSPSILGEAKTFDENMNCGQLIDLSYSDYVEERDCKDKRVTLRTWSGVYSNMRYDTSTCVQIITENDNSSLTMSNCPTEIIVENNYTLAHWDEPIPYASDNSTTITMSSNYSPGNYFPLGITNVVYTATDACGNDASCGFRVSVLYDATYPQCTEDIVVDCNPDGETIIDYTPPSYNDNCNTCSRGPSLPEFIYMGSYNGSNYYCSRKFYSYSEAVALSSKYGGHLATIDNEGENQYLAANIMTRTALIGYNDIDSEGSFEWSDGSRSTYTNWFDMQPNDYNNQDVVELIKNSGKWNDVEHDKKLEFVMELPCSPVRLISGPEPGEALNPGVHNVLYNISDGCGLDQYCSFTITVRESLALVCPDDISAVIPTGESDILVEWNNPLTSSCCMHCQDDCITLTQTSGPASGTVFTLQTKEVVTYTAIDSCGSIARCDFRITVDLEEFSGREGGQAGANNLVMDMAIQEEDGDYTLDSINLNYHQENRSPILAEIYPNPAYNVLNIKTKEYQNISQLRIIDQYGREVLAMSRLNSETTSIDISGLSRSIYFLITEYNNQEIKTTNFIKM